MRQQSHPNVLPLYCSFVHRQHLWMVMPYVAGGSVLNIMKFAYAEVWLWVGFSAPASSDRHEHNHICSYIAGPGGVHHSDHHQGGLEGAGLCAQTGWHPP